MRTAREVALCLLVTAGCSSNDTPADMGKPPLVCSADVTNGQTLVAMGTAQNLTLTVVISQLSKNLPGSFDNPLVNDLKGLEEVSTVVMNNGAVQVVFSRPVDVDAGTTSMMPRFTFQGQLFDSNTRCNIQRTYQVMIDGANAVTLM